MPPTLPDRAVAPEGNLDALAPAPADKRLVLPSLVRRAIELSGWKHDALAVAISQATGRSIDGPYLSKMLSGDKPLTAEVLEGLPDDVEAIVAQLYAESFGQVVVAPASDDSAVQHFVGGLLTLLRPSLPARASKMATSSLPAPAVRRAR